MVYRYSESAVNKDLAGIQIKACIGTTPTAGLKIKISLLTLEFFINQYAWITIVRIKNKG